MKTLHIFRNITIGKKILLVIAFVFFSTTVSAEPIKLTLHHFFVKEDVPQQQMLEPWAREVERLSNDQVQITIVPRIFSTLHKDILWCGA